MLYIIGSGPAGAAAAHALLAQGKRVTMLDVGTELEPEIAEKVRALANTTPELWDKATVDSLKQRNAPKTGGLPIKYLYGSDYPYRNAEEFTPIEKHDVETQLSFAKGGLSTVWGNSMLPYRPEDIKDWPITFQELVPYYEKVLQFVPLSGTDDMLSQEFPLFTQPQKLNPSKQAHAILEKARRKQKDLREMHLLVGQSRVAISGEKQGGCRYCGMCVYGCPYGVIYGSAQTIAQLQRNKNFTYINDVFVEKVEETQKGVKIIGKSTNGAVIFEGDRVFVGCGVIGTAKLLLNSVPQWQDRTIIIKDSQYFIVPIMQFKGASGVRKERLHTTAQMFFEIIDPHISKHTIHLQLYTYNEMYLNVIQQKIGDWKIFHLPSNMILDRLSVFIGFLHSDESPTIMMKLQDGKVILERHGHVHKKIINDSIKKLAKAGKSLGFAPVPPMLEIGKTGRSYHYGGSFPMSKEPKDGETDLFGRPHGMKRVHLIDPSTFPSVPATTIVLTIMANAYRIATEYDKVKK